MQTILLLVFTECVRNISYFCEIDMGAINLFNFAYFIAKARNLMFITFILFIGWLEVLQTIIHFHVLFIYNADDFRCLQLVE